MLHKESQLTFVRQYLELLNTVEQAFNYVENKPLFEQADALHLIIPDLWSSWIQLAVSHDALLDMLGDSPEIQALVEQFRDMVADFSETINVWSFSQEKMIQYVLNRLSPFYREWKTKTELILSPFVRH